MLESKPIRQVNLNTIFVANIPFFAVLFFLVATLYANTLNGQFLSADDLPGIVNNPQVQDFAGSMKTFDIEKMYPALLVKVFGMTPMPFHVVSIFLHFVATVLVFLFVFLLFGRNEAIIASLLFAAHPLNSEAVSWISAYWYPLFAIFTLLIMIFFFYSQIKENKKYYWIAVTLFMVEVVLYRKPWVLLTPVLLVMADQLIYSKKINFKRIKLYLIYLLPCIAYIIIWVIPQLRFRESSLQSLYYFDSTEATPYINRVFYTFFMTVKLMLVPLALTIYHEGEVVKSVGGFTLESGLMAVFVVLSIIFLLIRSQKTNKILKVRNGIVGALILMIFTSIIFSFSPQVLVWSMAERYLYLGTAFFCLIVALVVSSHPVLKPHTKTIIGILLVLYSVKVLIRTNAWKDNKNLWIATQKISPYSYRVYNNLGDVYSSEGNVDAAIRNFQISIQMNPKFADAVHNLGYAYMQKGDLAMAKTYLEKSFEMNPNLYQAQYKLGYIEYQLGNVAAAKTHFEKTLEINPGYEPAAEALRILANTNPSK
jgi:protein O-mannosyl-transferase